MADTTAKKSPACRIGMPRNGCKTSKSLSPVTRASAFAERAKDRNILSFGSLQTVTISFISTESAFEMMFSIKAMRISRDKYLSNFGLVKVVKYSAAVEGDINNVPVSRAFFNAKPGTEFSFNRALNKVFVSNTQNFLLIFQQFIQLIR